MRCDRRRRFRKALCRSHDAARIHGLVRRDQHELVDAGTVGHVHQVARADDVVEHRFAWVRLEQRHVLVRSGVEHDLRPEPREHALETVEVEAGVGEDDE